ncbi:MAG: hypothetical protein HZR80_10070 [Candidatus Heimdallarchaeota archaeon]
MNNCKSSGNHINLENAPDKNRFKRNIRLEKLTEILNEYNNEIYSYVLSSVKYDKSKFKQYGCAPNFQGNYVTLTTCKHYMRSYRKPQDWLNVWIAGFGDLNNELKKNFLFYLMQVKIAFISFKELWNFLKDDKETQNIKNSRFNPYGDIFEPKDEFTIIEENNAKDKSFKFYHIPIDGHKHLDKYESWKRDIFRFYKTTKRRPSLLVGNENNTFYWSKPRIYFKKRLPRNCKMFENIQDFIKFLEEK